jgi:hypothetical protein
MFANMQHAWFLFFLPLLLLLHHPQHPLLLLSPLSTPPQAATAFLPELLVPLTPTQRQELLPPLVTALVKDKYWNVRAAAAVMLANLLEEVKDLEEEERLSIR